MMLVPVGNAYTVSDFDISRAGGKFKALKKHIYSENITYLEDDLNEIQDYMELIHNGRISDQKEIIAFFNDDLKDIIKIILSKQYKDVRELRMISMLQPFVFQAFVLCLEMLHLDIMVILEILQGILANDSTCYSYTTLVSPRAMVSELSKKYPFIFSICPLTKTVYDEEWESGPSNYDAEFEKAIGGRDPSDNSLIVLAAKNVKFPGQNFIQTAKIHQKTSILYLLNVNYFLQIGGIETLTSYMKTTRSPVNLLLGTEIINQLCPFVEEEFSQRDIYPHLADSMSAFPTTLNPEEIKHTKKDEIVQLIKTLKNISKKSSRWGSYAEVLATYELEILLICLKSQYLDKRIFAISSLVEKISEVERSQKSLFNLTKEPSITKEAYIKFLEDHDIVSVLLGESSHSELLRRSSALFRFLFRHKRLSIEKVDFICRLAFEKHDTFRKQILKILGDLAELMDYGELEHLFENISQVNVQEIDQDVLQLVKTIGSNISIVRTPTSRKKRKIPEDGEENAYEGIGLPGSEHKGESSWETIFKLDKEDNKTRVVICEENIEEERNEIKKRKGPELDLEAEEGGLMEDFNDEQKRGLGQKVLDFLWKIILGLPDAKVGNAPLVTIATNILKDILTGKLESEKMKFIGKAINAIKRNLAVGEAFEVLQQIMKGKYPLNKADGSYITNKRELILYLDAEYSLTNTIFNSLILLKKELVGYLANNEAEVPAEGRTMGIEDSQHPQQTEKEDRRSQKENKSESAGIVLAPTQEEAASGQRIEEEVQDRENRVEETKEMERNSVSTGASSIDELSDDRSNARRPYFLMRTSENPTVSEVVSSYIKEIENRLRFVRTLKTTSYDQLEFKHANLLWNLLVDNAIYEQERDAFFTFFSNIVYSSANEYKILSEDVTNYIFSDILLNLDFHNYSLQTFNCFIEFFKYLNTRYDLIKQQQTTFVVNSLDLVGIDSLWELFFNSIDSQVVEKAQDFLLSLFKRVAEKKQRGILVETCFKNIDKAYRNLKEKSSLNNSDDSLQRISRCLDFISTFLQEFGELHAQSHSFSPEYAINVVISNQMSNAMAPKKFPLTLYKTMTVREAKELIASRLNPPVSPDEVMLMSRGSIFQGDNTLLEDLPWKLESDQTIMCTKNTTVEDMDPLGVAGTSVGPQQNEEGTAEFETKVETLKMFISGVEDDLIRYVLKKKNGDVDNAAMALLDETEQESLRTQFEREQEKLKKKDNKKSKSSEDEVRLSEMLSNNDEIFELFFKLLTLEIEEIEAKVWNLLMNLPLNRNMYYRLRNVFQKSNLKQKGSFDAQEDFKEEEARNIKMHQDGSMIDNNNSIQWGLDWSEILNANSNPKLLYSLRIVSNLVSCGILDERDSELYIKAEWRLHFLENAGLSYLQGLLLKFSEFTSLKKANQTSSTAKPHNTEARIFSLILDILKVYVQPALLALSSGTRRELIMEVFTAQNKPKAVEKTAEKSKPKSIWDQHPSNSNWPNYAEKRPGNDTPTFGWSPDNSKSASPGVIPGPAAPAYDGSNIKNLFNNSVNNNINKENVAPTENYEQIDEFQTFLKEVENNDGQLARQILNNVTFEEFIVIGLRVIEASLAFIENDKNLAKLVEDEFKFVLPCFVAYPGLLQILYKFEGVRYIEKTVFFRCKQESVKDIVAYMIMFLSKHSHKILDKDMEEALKPAKKDGRMSLENLDGEEVHVDKSKDDNKPDMLLESNGHNHGGLKEDIRSSQEMNIEDIRRESPQSFFLKTLLPLVYDCKTEEDVSLEYFETVSSLIKMTPKEIVNTITDLTSLYIFAIKCVRDRPIFENRSSEVGDKVLRGFLQLAETLVGVEPGVQKVFEGELLHPELQNIDLLKDLYDFLFYLPGENERVDPSLNLPKCKHKKTRAHVFRLLKILSTNNKSNLSKMLGLLALNHQKLPNFSMESSASSMVNFELKNSTGYVGLKNLGCTCYMNSLLQQFFMIIPLRNALLNSEVSVKLPGPIENEEEQVFLSQVSKDVYEANEKYLETQLNDNVLYQLQLLLGRLKESVSECVVPQKFFDSIKTINGEKIVVNVQQDVNEFFNTLCDKLEQCMKDTPQKTVLNDLIGGTLSHEIISLETDFPYYGEREEAYLTIPLDIKGKRNIYDALDFYVKEDTLEGDNKYHCEQYDRKIKVMKRCCIKSLPNTLIITLKRFDFDFNSMQKVKINDYFEFPTTLNLKQWTKSGLKDQIPAEANYEPPNHDDNYYEYELVGVLVHSGTADAGHYYSFIKDRSNAKKGWFEFNDNRVKPFDIKNLKNECFGSDGVESKSVFDFEFVKTRNAYILLYERSKLEDNSTYVKYKDTDVPQALCETIWRENLELLRSKYFYDVDYFKFVMDLFKLYQFPIVVNIPESYSEPVEMALLRKEAEKTQKMIQAMEKFASTGEPVETMEEMDIKPTDIVSAEYSDEDIYGEHTKTLRLAIVLASEIYLKSKDSEEFESWIQLIQSALEKFIPGNIWLLKFITQHPDFLKLMYGEGISSSVKEAVKDLFTKVIPKVHKIEAYYFTEEEEFKVCNQQYKLETRTIRKSSLARFLKTFTQSFFKGKKDLSKPLDYFNLVLYLIKMNRLVAEFLIYEGLLIDSFDLFLQIQKTLLGTFSIGSAMAKEKEKYHATNVKLIFQIVEALIKACSTEQMAEQKTLPPSYLFYPNIDWKTCPKLPEKIIDRTVEFDNFTKYFLPMEEKSNGFHTILQHICWENADVSKKVIQHLIPQVCSFMANSRMVNEYAKILYYLIVLNDQHQAFRIECMFLETISRTMIVSTRGHDLVSWMQKARESYDKVPCILVIKWLGRIIQEVPAFKEYIAQNLDKFEWIVYFLEENMHAKQSFYTIIDSELMARIPQDIKTSFEIFTEVIPFNPKPRVEAVKVDVIEEEPEEKEPKKSDLFSRANDPQFKGWSNNQWEDDEPGV